MTLYAYYDYTLPDPSPVIGWIDTDFYSNTLPDFRSLLVLTQDQWDTRLDNPSGWAIDGGDLISYTAPIPLPQQAQTLLAQKLNNGVVITSASSPGVNGTYALDAQSTSQIFQIGSFANSFGVFPSGDTVQYYPDRDSVPHTFSVPVFVAFLRGVASLVADMQAQAGIMSQGGTPVWPLQQRNII